ncbi:hypothetical protein KSP40_PGU020135 [Platanthera guangdongensis]|uniref:Uncharacterized protein n=1 Tax=Platanthera guangdongensis TaxID=2320717 RepID=A0ABR2LDA2_9ASPA
MRPKAARAHRARAMRRRSYLRERQFSPAGPPKAYPRRGDSFGMSRIYVHDLPPEFDCAAHLFAAESLHEALLGSSALPVNPRNANFFFVNVSCSFSASNGFPVLRHACPPLSSATSFLPDGGGQRQRRLDQTPRRALMDGDQPLYE